MLISAVLRTVGFCNRHPWPVIVVAAVLAIGSALYTATHFAITTNTDQLLPKDLPWRQHELAYRTCSRRIRSLSLCKAGRRSS